MKLRRRVLLHANGGSRRMRAAGLGSILAVAVGLGFTGSRLVAFASEPACSGAVPHPAGGCLFGGFEIDGNTVPDGSGLDWTSTAVGGSAAYTPFYDLFNTTSDNIMSNGSKESDQSTWSCVNGKPPGKSDLGGPWYTTGQFAPVGGVPWAGSLWFQNTNPGGAGNVQFLYGNFQRFATDGDVHIDYEFNRHPATTANHAPGCPTLAQRSQGDLLITFDTNQGGASIFVSAFTFGCGAAVGTFCTPGTGSFVLGSGLADGSTFDGTANIAPALSDAGVKAGAYGEAGLDLTHTIGNFTCGEFGAAFMKTRSSGTSDIANGKAEVKDITSPVPFNPGLCPTSHLAKWQVDETTSGADAAGTDESGATDQSADQTLASTPTGNQDCSSNDSIAGTCAAGATTTPMGANPGDELVYRLVYTNSGAGTAPNPVVTDSIPTGTTYVTGSQSCPTSSNCIAAAANGFNAADPCSSTAGTGAVTNLVWCLPAEAPTGAGAGVSMTFEVTLPSSQATSGAVVFENHGHVTDTQVTSDTGSNSNFVAAQASFAPASGLVKTEADVQSNALTCNTASIGNVTSTPSCIEVPGSLTSIASAVFVAGPITANPTDIVAYKLVYTNKGDSSATSVTVTDSIPAGSTYVATSCSNSCTTTTSLGVVTRLAWNLGTVAPCAVGVTPCSTAVAVTFEVRLNSVFPAWNGSGPAPSGNKVTNIGGVTSTDESTNIPSNSVEADVPAAADLGLVKTAGAPFTDNTGLTCPAGKTCVTWTIAFYNTGNGSLTGQSISDTLPGGVGYVSCLGGSPACSQSGGIVTWTVGIPGGTTANNPAGTVTVTIDY